MWPADLPIDTGKASTGELSSSSNQSFDTHFLLWEFEASLSLLERQEVDHVFQRST
jgi:hypothetical protein